MRGHSSNKLGWQYDQIILVARLRQVGGLNFFVITLLRLLIVWKFYIFLSAPKQNEPLFAQSIWRNAVKCSGRHSISWSFLIRSAISCQKSFYVAFDLTPALIPSLHVRDRKWVFYEHSPIISIVSFSLFVVKGHCKPLYFYQIYLQKNDKYLLAYTHTRDTVKTNYIRVFIFRSISKSLKR